jgi:uncharacterized membrane protein (UPF0127 family)
MFLRFHTTGFFNPVFFCARSRYNPIKNRLIRLAAILSASLIPQLAAAQAALLPTTELRVGTSAVNAEIASTEATRAYGLMHRKSLPENHGMLFVFDTTDVYCFWMKNTPLPLSIAFIDAKGEVVNTAEMQPLSEQPHCPAKPIRYALEMNKSWFASHGVAAGTRVSGLPRP